MPNEPSVFESPWIQLGVPLISAALSAADRTRRGNIGQAGQIVSGGVQGYGRQLQKERLSQIKMDEEAAEDAEFEKSYEDIGKAEDPTTSEQLAPEGGSTPAADRGARTESFEMGTVPKPTFRLEPNQREQIRTLHKGVGRKAAAQRLSEFQAEYDKPAPQKADYHTNVTNEYGDQILYTKDGDTGALSGSHLAGPKPDTSRSEFEAWMDPATRPDVEKYKELGRQPQQPRAQNWQVQPANDGTLYRVNPDTGEMRPFQAPGAAQDRPLNDFSDVTSDSTSTAQAVQGPSAQVGKSQPAQGGQVPSAPAAQGQKGPSFAKGRGNSGYQVEIRSRQFDRLPVVQRAQIAAEAITFAESMDINHTNPQLDQGLIYAYAKAMDPDSAVREGEYATVQKYAQTLAERLGFNAKRLLANTEFLTVEARQNLTEAIRLRGQSTIGQYRNVREQYANQINRLTGEDGGSYLVDYEKGFPQSKAQEGQSQTSKSGRPIKKNASGQWVYAD